MYTLCYIVAVQHHCCDYICNKANFCTLWSVISFSQTGLWEPCIIDFHIHRSAIPSMFLVCSGQCLSKLVRGRNRRTSDVVVGSQASLMCVGSEGRPVWSHQQTKEFMLVLIKGVRAVGAQSGCWLLSTTESANNVLQNWTTEWWKKTFFYITWIIRCMCFICHLSASGQRRQCDALGRVLLGNLGTRHLCGFTSTRTTYLSIFADHVHFFMGNLASLMLWPLSAG